MVQGEVMKVGVVGLGYVGLVTATVLASRGNELVGIDIDTSRIEALNRGRIPIVEPGLDELFRQSRDRMSFHTDFSRLGGCRVVFITLPTPTVDGRIDLSALIAGCDGVARHAPGCDIAIKSTVVPGTARMIGQRTGMNVIANPEFTREGSAVMDTEKPDRVVVGGKETSRVEEIWAFTGAPVIRTTWENAEMIKYASNAFLACKISFINEMADLCEKIPGCDVEIVAAGMGMDRRIGPHFLRAGLGYGGSCFPKDTEALASYARERGTRLSLVESAMDVNSRRILHVADAADRIVPLKGARVALLGLAFKENTDDLRGSRSLLLLSELLRRGAHVTVYDPVVRYAPDGVYMARDLASAVEGSDIIILATEWPEFRQLEKMALSVPVFDGRRLLNPSSFSNYSGVGYSCG